MISRLSCLAIFYTFFSNQISCRYAEAINGPGMKVAIDKTYAYTYTALISNKSSSNILEKFLCTGTLISGKLVLTVAECIQDLPVEDTEVIFRHINREELGIRDGFNQRADSPSQSGSDSFSDPIQHVSSGPYAATKIMTSSMWSQMQNKLSGVPSFNDLAVIQLDRSVAYGPAIISYFDDQQKIGTSVELVGWGKVDKVLLNKEDKLYKGENDMVQFGLPQRAVMNIMTKSGCEKKINGLSWYHNKFKLPDNIFCISSPTKDVALHGDIGGPVIFGSNHLIGVTVKRTLTPTPNWLDKGPVNFVLRLQEFREFIQYSIDRDFQNLDLY